MKKTIKISAILLALIMAVSVFAISPISASAASSGWNTIWDAESDVKPSVGGTTAYAIKNDEGCINTGNNSTKILKVFRQGAYNIMSVNFPIEAGTLTDATQLRVWVGKKSTNGSKYNTANFGLKFTDGETVTYYGVGFRADYDMPCTLSENGAWYAIDLTSNSIIVNSKASFKGSQFSTQNNWSNASQFPKINSLDFSKCTGIYVNFGKPVDNGEKGTANDTYYIDDLQYYVAGKTPVAKFEGTTTVIADKEALSVTLPKSSDVTVADGGYLVGWKSSDGGFYKPGAEVGLTEDVTFTAIGLDMSMSAGASIRWAQTADDRGLRFQTKIKASDLERLSAATTFTTGTLIVPASAGCANSNKIEGLDDAGEFDIGRAVNSINNGLNVVNTNNLMYGEADGYKYYYGGVTGMMISDNAELDSSKVVSLSITARPYMTITYKNGSTTSSSNIGTGTYYPKYTQGTCTRSMKQIATAAYNDTTMNYSKTQMSILKDQYGAVVVEGSSDDYIKESSDALGK